MKTKRFINFIVLLNISLSSFGQYVFTDEIKLPCTKVKDQQLTGTCWSFATTSFLESEIMRLNGKDIDLSALFNVRLSFLDKSQNYILRQGNARFEQGGLAHDALAIVEHYGIIPQEFYTGLGKDDGSLNHIEMTASLKAFLDAIIKVGNPGKHWYEAFNGILDSYMGSVPPFFVYNNKEYSPIDFKQAMRIKTDQYVGITSFTHHPFNAYFILEVPDNYRNGSFFNVKLGEMLEIADYALDKGYTFIWDGDYSELGISQKNGLAVLPVDSNSDSIFIKPLKEVLVTQDDRQTNFLNYSTTEDHLMHIIGKAIDQNNTEYYIVKNSMGEIGPYKGLLYMSKAYFSMKTISITLHKASLPKEISGKL